MMTTNLRLWPGVIGATLLVAIALVLPALFPTARPFGLPVGIFAMLAGGGAAAAIVLWWLFFSRAPWLDRLAAIVLMVVAIFVMRPFLHETMSGAGMGMMFYFFAAQTMTFALVASAVTTRSLSSGARRVSMIAAILLACGVWAFARAGGISGAGQAQLQWRWTLSPEERLLAQGREEPPAATLPDAAPPAISEKSAPAASPASSGASVEKPAPGASVGKETASGEDPGVAKREVVWPGFRGPNRDSVIRGVTIPTDWTTSAPAELWRHPIGPGWSSFAVDSSAIYTQEQRGEEEVVAAYSLKTGAPLWKHRDPVRFDEFAGGPGPRGTPTLANGRVYAVGATGVLNALNARDGSRIWSRNAATDTEVAVPTWGIASSPLVINDVVIVAVSGRLIAYDAATGERRWIGPKGGAGYSSPHLFTLDGVAQVVLLRGSRTISVAPADGALLWEHTWQPGATIVQPALTPDGDVLVSVADASGLGMRRLAVSKDASGWNVQERWTTTGLKPYFNDFVVHKGHAYGFDNSILSAIDLNDGSRKWKGGRYGHGQMLLLADQDALLVLSEEGDLALVSATPDRFSEITRFKVLEGKTWNHPVLVGNVLLVRNGEEMAAFRLR